MFDLAINESYTRLKDIRTMLSFIKDNESKQIIKQPDMPAIVNMRGLFYVMLYSAIEHSFQSLVSKYLLYLNDKNIHSDHINFMFYAIANDNKFTMIQNRYITTAKGTLDARIDFIGGLENSNIKINSNFFDVYGQNISPKFLETASKCLCINNLQINDPDRGYLIEITEKRNQIAHGRDTAYNVGKSVRSGELKLRYNATYRIVNHFITVFESEAIKPSCLNPTFQSRYL